METFGTAKKYHEYVGENPICEMGKFGRYREQSGRYFAAQIPSTIRDCHDLPGDGVTLLIVLAIRRITSSGSLSSYRTVREGIVFRKLAGYLP